MFQEMRIVRENNYLKKGAYSHIGLMLHRLDFPTMRRFVPNVYTACIPKVEGAG